MGKELISPVMGEHLEKRMYFFVIYQLTGIQKGIQCGHTVEQYAHNYRDDVDYINFVENWKTWIVLDGGTTNNNIDTLDFGTLNKILIELRENNIKHGYFHEPDLNNALTAVCFMADERVFDFVKFPDYIKPEFISGDTEIEFFENENYSKHLYTQWLESIGGEYNLYLRELIKGKRKASN